MDSAAIPTRSSSSRRWAAILSLPNWNGVSGMALIQVYNHTAFDDSIRLGRRLSIASRTTNAGFCSLFGRFLVFGDLLLRFAPS